MNDQIRSAAYNALGDRIIGQGEKVERFEKLLAKRLGNDILTVNSGTSALELAYHLLNLKPGDEVISPVFTCAATNIPLVRREVKIIFADVKDDLTLDFEDAKKRITKNTKAIVNVHLFDRENRIPNSSIPVIGDAAQYLGRTTGETFTAYSFQATKIITTVDGGALRCKKGQDFRRAKLLRWYGIDRETPKNTIDVDIEEAGYKYHLSDVAASIGIASLLFLDKLRAGRLFLQDCYRKYLQSIPGIQLIGGSPFLIHTTNRNSLIKKLSASGIEAGLVHRRNDLYSVFGGERLDLPNMNRLESNYLLLPCHHNMNEEDVRFICQTVRESL